MLYQTMTLSIGVYQTINGYFAHSIMRKQTKHHKYLLSKETWKSLGTIVMIWAIAIALLLVFVWFIKGHIKIGG